MRSPDPDVFYDVEGDEVTQSVYQGLVRYAPDSTRIVAQLATSWTVSADKRTSPSASAAACASTTGRR